MATKYKKKTKKFNYKVLKALRGYGVDNDTYRSSIGTILFYYMSWNKGIRYT